MKTFLGIFAHSLTQTLHSSRLIRITRPFTSSGSADIALFALGFVIEHWRSTSRAVSSGFGSARTPSMTE